MLTSCHYFMKKLIKYVNSGKNNNSYDQWKSLKEQKSTTYACAQFHDYGKCVSIPFAGLFPPNEIQFPLTENKFPSTENQFPPNENQFPPTENQFPPTENQFPLTENHFLLLKINFLLLKINFPLLKINFLLPKINFLKWKWYSFSCLLIFHLMLLLTFFSLLKCSQ